MAKNRNFDRNPQRGCNFGSEGGAVLDLRGCIVFDNSTVTPRQTGGYRSNIRIPAQSDTCINESPGKSFLSSSATK